jgi:hypothetical protein
MTQWIRSSRAVRLWLEAAAVVVTYAGLTFGLLYPLFLDPAHTVLDTLAQPGLGWMSYPDINLVTWVLSWDCHALATHPLELFNANIFYPAPLALAGSEHMLGHLPIFGPIYAISGNPVLANQLNTFFAIVLSGAAMYALLRHWDVARVGALFGGFVYAFCPSRTHDIVHSHLLAGQYLPLALLYLDRTLIGAGKRSAAAFAVFLLLQALCSYYLAYMSVIAIAGYALGVLWSTRGRLRLRGVLLAMLAALAAGTFLAALSLPYVRLKGAAVIADYGQSYWLRVSATDLWRNYLYPPIAYGRWGWRLRSGTPIYVGLVPLAFVLFALFLPRGVSAGPSRWARAGVLGIVVACYLMALGPDASIGTWHIPLPYGVMMRYVPGFSSMRQPSRFGLVFMTGFAALAGIGFGRVLPLCRERLIRWFGPVMLVVLACATAYEYDLVRSRFVVRVVPTGSDVPLVYRALAALPRGPVLEIPAGGLAGELVGRGVESDYMLYSTLHWNPLLNGYSGYRPQSYDVTMTLARVLPGPTATELLARTTGLRYVIVHLAAMPPEERARWSDFGPLQPAGRFGTDLLLTVPSTWADDLRDGLIDFRPRTKTLLGTPLQPLPKSGQQAEISLGGSIPRSMFAGLSGRIEVLVRNRSPMPWPALVSVGDHIVTLACRWEDESGHVIDQAPAAARLPYDLQPGESVRAAITIQAPPPGKRRLVVGLSQDGRWFPDTAPPVVIDVFPWPANW